MGKHVHLLTRMPHSGIQIPCQKQNPTLISSDYIYLISYKIAQKVKSLYKTLPL